MRLAAVIQKREHLTIRNSVEYVAWLYDKDRPRDLEAECPSARYASVGFVGPYRQIGLAVRDAEASIAAGEVVNIPAPKQGRRRTL